MLLDNPSARIRYVSAERFTNEFIWALQNHRIEEFRKLVEKHKQGDTVALLVRRGEGALYVPLEVGTG